MTYRTHKEFSIAFVYMGVIVLYHFNYLSNVNYILALMIMLPISKIGAAFPDWDIGNGDIPYSTGFSRFINKVLIFLGAKHRSRHTHSLDLCIIFLILSLSLPNLVNSKVSDLNAGILELILLGFGCGWLSHLLSDMLNKEGIYLSFLFNKKFALKIFRTSSDIEKGLSKVIFYLNKVLFLVYLYYGYKFGFLLKM